MTGERLVLLASLGLDLTAPVIGYGAVVPAESAAREALADFASEWFGGEGVGMTVDERTAWSARFAALLPAGIKDGHEAFVLGGGPPIATLRGFEVLGPRPAAPWHGSMSLCEPGDVALLEPYGEAHEAALRALGALAGMGVPEIPLLCGNSTDSGTHGQSPHQARLAARGCLGEVIEAPA